MDFIASFIQKHRLPDNFLAVAQKHYLPLCAQIDSAIGAKKSQSPEPFLLGINGAQGTGKSTLADFIADYARQLPQDKKLEVAVVSIDDFYLTKADRNDLASRVHPLLSTRGVPGTHDLPLAFQCLSRLLAGDAQVALPRFDKSVDDRQDENLWPRTSAPVDLIILEGWCVGSVPEEPEALKEPVNELESEEDGQALWRSFVNNSLATDYQKLFQQLDSFILLKAPDFDAVYRWRLEQEQKLAQKTLLSGGQATAIMDETQIARFIQHYERLTRHNLAVLPERAQTVLELDQNHQVI